MIKKATQNNPVMHLRNSNFKDETKKRHCLKLYQKITSEPN